MAYELPSVRVLAVLAVGGALGTISRYLVGGLFTRSTFPWGTATVNITGSLLLSLFIFGGVMQGYASPTARLGFGVAFLGAYTTMSTFSVETLALLEDAEWARASWNVVLNPVLCLAGAYLGRMLAYLAPAGGG